MAHNRVLTHTLLFCLAVLMSSWSQVHSASFIFGGEAKRVCKAYKKICPSGKVCALQSIDWPRSMKFPVCVHEKKIVVKYRLCRKPPQPGKCGAQFVRWYFNVHMGACSWFTYSGCGGNRNNFRTAAECERRCVSRDEVSRNGDRQRYETKDVVVQEVDKGSNRDSNARSGEDQEPITALARAAEDLDLDVINSGNKDNDRSVTAREERRRKKELRRRARKQRRRKRKELEKLSRSHGRNHLIGLRRITQVMTPQPPVGRRRPARKLTLLELGPNYGLVTATPSQPSSWSSSTSSTGQVVISRSDVPAEVRRPAGRTAARGKAARRGYLEVRGRGVTRYDPDRGSDTPIWLMDELLNQGDEARRAERRRHRRRNHHNYRGSSRGGYRENRSRKPTISISVRNIPASSSRLTPARSPSSANSINDSNSRNSRYSYNQSYRPRDRAHTYGKHLASSNLADTPTLPQNATAGNSMKKPYYDRLKLFDLLEDPKKKMKLEQQK